MLKWCACGVGELSPGHGTSEHAALGIVRAAIVLESRDIQDAGVAHRAGDITLKWIERFDFTDLLPGAHEVRYRCIAARVEPFQSYADVFERGFRIGLSAGDVPTAVNLGVQCIQKSLLGGSHLPTPKRERNRQIRLIDVHSRPLHKMHMSVMQETISMLIERGGSSDLSRPNYVLQVKEFSRDLVFHGAMQHFWLGHCGRRLYHAEKSSPPDLGELGTIVILFYGSLACFHRGRKHREDAKNKRQNFVQHAMEVINQRGDTSHWNCKNKIYSLEAEMLSATDEAKVKATLKSNVAIKAAISPKFVHEEGLSCESAALHCLKHGDAEEASTLFQQALECYTKWGSQVKIDFIKKQLEKIGTSSR